MGSLESRCVVDPVTGHGDDLPVCFQCFDDPQLGLREHTGKQMGLPHRLAQGHLVHGHDVGTGQGRATFAEPRFAGNGKYRIQVIAGDHLELYASIVK